MIGAMRKSIYTSEYAALCEELRAARRDAGLSQRALAERLEVSPSWVAKVEANTRGVKMPQETGRIMASSELPMRIQSSASSE